jgi:hypothetical protein
MQTRDLVQVAEADHQLTAASQTAGAGFYELHTGQIVSLACSCGWSTRLALHKRELEAAPSGMVQDSVLLWVRYERLQHLLDQEIKPAAVLSKLVEQGLVLEGYEEEES